MAAKKRTTSSNHTLPPVLGRICRIPLSPDETVRGVVTPPQMHEITWRIFRIMAEFVEGFQFLSSFQREVTIFGSARLPETSPWYQEARKLGQLLGECGYTVITGGGPGIMEAANRGAYERDGESVGLNIQLPMEQRINPYVKKSRAFYYFFTRKVMLAASAQAYVYFPGGYGTLDELFEILTLVQTGKMAHIPIVLVGKSFWRPLFDWVQEHQLKNDLISPEDRHIFRIVDTAEEAFDIIQSESKERSFF